MFSRSGKTVVIMVSFKVLILRHIKSQNTSNRAETRAIWVNEDAEHHGGIKSEIW